MKISKSIYWIVFFSICFILNELIAHGNVRSRPNFVIIIADDLGWNDLGAYGNKEVSTPNINKISKEGIKFNNAYLTTSSCSPSRSSIISGRYPHNTGFPEFTHMGALAEGIPIFPELLQKAGYYTAQAGKWHLGDSVRRGFDAINKNKGGPGGEEQWISTLRDRPDNKPFFMWFASTDPHRGWGPNEFSGTNDPKNIIPPPYLANTSSTREDIAKYYDEITRFDSYVGKVEEELERQGVLDNTILIIISDNGAPFPRAKTRLYDSGIKTPLIVKWEKGIDKVGSVSNSMISVIDIGPTLIDIAGVDIPASFQGKSFKKILKDPTTEEFRTYVFAEYNWHGFETYERMVRTRNFMYIINERPSLSNSPPSDAIKSPSFEDLKQLRNKGELTVAQYDIFKTPRPFEELYDCINDPLQMINIASLPKYENELKRLRNIMNQWQQETADSVPDELTPDSRDRETGKLLKNIEIHEGISPSFRGEKPGKPNATKITSGGPF